MALSHTTIGLEPFFIDIRKSEIQISREI